MNHTICLETNNVSSSRPREMGSSSFEVMSLATQNQPATGVNLSENVFNTLVVYQNTLIRNCVKDAPWPPPHRAGNQSVQSVSWYEVKCLRDPFDLADAVSTALTADVIVISVEAADELPLDLYVWIDLWLPRRLARAGALAALIGVFDPPDSREVKTREYLRAVAKKGGLDFFFQEHKQPVESAAISLQAIVKQASTAMRALRQLHNPDSELSVHWGINE